MKRASVTVKPIVDMAGCYYLQEVHKRIWTGSGGIEIIASHVLITLAKNGGLVLAAYAPEGPAETGGMVGFIVGWLATVPETEGIATPPKLKHCSHIAGVLPDWQGRGIGLQLKLAQREAVLAQGVTDYATWTYDPLYWVNGRMNIHRLGAICNTYKRDVYGQMDDALNAGAPTDRCQVDWYLRSPRVEHALAEGRQDPPWDTDAMQILPTCQTPDGLAEPAPYHLQLDGRPIALPLPDDVAALRSQDNELLIAWRLFTREVFEGAFEAGYAMVDCLKLPQGAWHYILIPLTNQDMQTSNWP